MKRLLIQLPTAGSPELVPTAGSMEGEPGGSDPIDLRLRQASPETLEFEWRLPEVPVEGLVLSWRQGLVPPPDCPVEDQQSIAFPQTTSYRLTGLTPGTTYAIRLCALMNLREGEVSSGVTLVADTEEGPDEPPLMPIPEVDGLRCTNLDNDPRVHWTGGTQLYLWLMRRTDSPAARCDQGGSELVEGRIGANSRTTGGQLNESYIVWICGVDPDHPDGHSEGRRIQVTMPRVVDDALLPGDCAPID